MSKRQRKVGEAKSAIVSEPPLACCDETAAVEFMERQRWGDSPGCPRCGSVEVYKMADRKTGERNRRYLWRCRDCKRQFSVRIGTVLEDSRIPLRHWCFAFWAACSSKKGVSALQIQRQTGLSYKSALFLLHRVRFAMSGDTENPPQLSGTVEVDETYVGGKPRHKGRPENRKIQGYGTKKAPVMALVERGGNVRAFPLDKVTSRNLQLAIREHVAPSARIITDEHQGYPGVARHFAGGHDTVKHSAKEYVRGDVHTNTVEGFFSRIKRSIIGIHHSVSKRHLHRYVDHMAFLHNTRALEDGARTVRAIRGAEGKRLRYRTAQP